VDILVLAAVRPAVFITSVELRNTFPLGMLAWFGGSIFVERRSPAGLKKEIRDIARTLQELMFREMFEFRFMQTDPNLANYLYLPATGQLALLDLGSVCEYPEPFVESYRRVCRAVIAGSTAAIREAAFEIGYAGAGDPEAMVRGTVEIMQLVCEPLAHRGQYDFAGSGLIGRARDLGLSVAVSGGLRSPPPETIFLHRKLIGTFLICSKLRARVNVHALIERFL
jgi:predicted unusual protein kinase regulating ubiquinone biosynthesis (AarF/ABC1/UbiB family)